MRHAAGRLPPRLAWPVLCFIAIFASGCLTLTSTLRPDGSGTLDMRYRVGEDPTIAAEKPRFVSPHFTIQEFTVDAAKREVHVVGTLDEVTKLSSVPFFKDVAVTRSQEGGDEQMTFVVTKEKPIELPKGQPGPDVTITLPGAVTAAEPKANVETTGSTVRWRFPLEEFAREKTTTLTVRWKAPAAGAAKPAATPTADATPPKAPTP